MQGSAVMFCVVGDKIERERENMRTCGVCVPLLSFPTMSFYGGDVLA